MGYDLKVPPYELASLLQIIFKKIGRFLSQHFIVIEMKFYKNLLQTRLRKAKNYFYKKTTGSQLRWQCLNSLV